MKKIYFLPLLISILFLGGCDDNNDPKRVAFTLDGTTYIANSPEAFLTFKGNDLYDILIIGERSDFTIRITLDNVPLTSVYPNIAEFILANTTGSLESGDCVQNISTTVIFDGLNNNSRRLDGEFTGYVCNGVDEFEITNGLIENVPVR